MLAWFSEDGGTLFPRGTIAFFSHSAKITNICVNVPVRGKKTVDSFPYWLVGKPEIMRKCFLLLRNISTKFDTHAFENLPLSLCNPLRTYIY